MAVRFEVGIFMSNRGFLPFVKEEHEEPTRLFLEGLVERYNDRSTRVSRGKFIKMLIDNHGKDGSKELDPYVWSELIVDILKSRKKKEGFFSVFDDSPLYPTGSLFHLLSVRGIFEGRCKVRKPIDSFWTFVAGKSNY